MKLCKISALAGAVLAGLVPAHAQNPLGGTTVVHRFYGPSPVGVTLSHTGRIFVSFSRGVDNGPYTFGELVSDDIKPYPSAQINKVSDTPRAKRLVSVQGITVDAKDRLWLLDSGVIGKNPTAYGGPKLVCVDLTKNAIVRTILFSRSVAGPTAYLNDVRVDAVRGFAYITDSSEAGPTGLVVVNINKGTAVRRLNNHPSTKAEPGFVPIVEGLPVLKRSPGKPPKRDTTGSDGIALSPDGSTLYYCPNEGRRLYSVSAAALRDPAKTEGAVDATVKDLGAKPGASDGIEVMYRDTVLVTDYEHNAVRARLSDGRFLTVAQGSKLIWPDSIFVTKGEDVYFTVNQLNRQAKFHNGRDIRRRPFLLVKTHFALRSAPVSVPAGITP